jgi:hypothetical protein
LEDILAHSFRGFSSLWQGGYDGIEPELFNSWLPGSRERERERERQRERDRETETEAERGPE